jgi:hypothetical protein
MSLNSFKLTLFEAEQINKIIPYPYKIELESNITFDFLNNKTKRISTNIKSHSLNTRNKSQSKLSANANTNENSSITINISKKKVPEKQNINTLNNKNVNSTNNDSERKICEKFFAYIENCEYCNIFYTQKYLDEPCLIDIESKIKGRKYHHLLDIVMDLRNLCLYYSDKKFNNTINYNANKLLEFVESKYKSFYPEAKKDYKEALKMALKMDTENNKMFSEKDLFQMSEQIKKLNPKQLIGLVKLIKTLYQDNNDLKYYEIDLKDLDLNTLNKINFYIKNVNKK